MSSQQTYRQKWILSLVSIGLIPIIELIESGTGEGAPEAEQRWIASYRANGVRLVNGTEGGDGVHPWGTHELRSDAARRGAATISPERKSAIAKKRWAGLTPEQRREKASKIFTSRRSATENAKLSWETFRSLPLEEQAQRAAKAKATKANWTEEQQAENAGKQIDASRTWHASRTPEERSAAAVKRVSGMTWEQHSERLKRAQASRTPEQRSETAKRRQAAKTPEQRSAEVKKGLAKLTPEERSARARHAALVRNSQMTPEERCESTRLAREGRARNRLLKVPPPSQTQP